MLSLCFKVLRVILLIFHLPLCTLTSGHFPTIGQAVAHDTQEDYTNSVHQFQSKSGNISNSEDSSKHKSKRGTQNEFLACCSTYQPKPVDGYYYTFHVPSSRSFINSIDIISVGYAYLSAIESHVLKKSHRYFDIDNFLNKSGIVFPPTLPLVCYDTAYSLHESPLFNYGRDHMLRVLNSAEDNSDTRPSRGRTRRSATRHLNNTTDYMIQRQKMYGELGNLVQNLRQGQKETLKAKCSQAAYTKITDVLYRLLRPTTIQVISPQYSIEQFNEVVKMFIGDIVAYEIIRQACMSTCPLQTESIPQVTADDWRPIAEELRAAASAINVRTSWQTQLKSDIKESTLDRNGDNGPSTSAFDVSSSPHSFFEDLHSDALMKKYYQYGFRVSSHKKWESVANVITEVCNNQQNQKCIVKHGKLFLVKWKSLKPADLASSYEIEQHHIKFPKVTPPSALHQFSGLYTKVQVAFKKCQNAVHYFRINERQKSHYKNVSNLIYAFDHSAGYDLYSETAEDFAKTLDAVNVFEEEFLPLIKTLSEVAMHAGKTGIHKIWCLIDRSFHEMVFYMADIEEHMMQMRLTFKEKYMVLSAALIDDANEFLFGDRRVEVMTKIQLAFKKYQLHARFYTKQGNMHGTPVVLKDFIDKCRVVKLLIGNLFDGMKSSDLEDAVRLLGEMGPFYVQAFFLVPSYDIMYLTLYSMFCTCQRYRWLAERNLVSIDSRMSSDDIQQFIRSTQQDVMEMDTKLHQLVEGIAKHVYKGEFHWRNQLWEELAVESDANETVAEAERIASKLKGIFQWNNFTVDLIKPHSPVYYPNFFANPDYSMVFINHWLRTIIVNWVLDRMDYGVPVQHAGENFSIQANFVALCNLTPIPMAWNLVNYRKIKSIFIWRAQVGYFWHRGRHDDLQDHDMEVNRSFTHRPCCGYGGANLSIKRSEHSCWYKYEREQCNRRSSYCYTDAKVDIYALGNFGDD